MPKNMHGGTSGTPGHDSDEFAEALKEFDSAFGLSGAPESDGEAADNPQDDFDSQPKPGEWGDEAALRQQAARAKAVRDGASARDNLFGRAQQELATIDSRLVEISQEIKWLNPPKLRLLKPRRKNKLSGKGTRAYAGLLGKDLPTSALRLNLHACGNTHCTGCPHAQWGVWRLFRDRLSGKTRRIHSHLPSTQQALAHARRAPSAKTYELALEALALLKAKRNLVEAINLLGRKMRAKRPGSVS
jgi:hypothetical protein